MTSTRQREDLRPHAVEPLIVHTIETPSLGDRSYLVHDGTSAVAIDPQRDIDRILAVLERDGLHLTHVFETHIHNDYVSGGLALSRHTGARYLVNAADPVTFDRTPVADGDVVDVGDRIRIRVLATPGHTFTHLSYVLVDRSDDAHVAVFTGGSMLFGASGRPDLLGPEHAETLARHQHASARRLAEALPDSTEVLPTHGFGSFCAATQSEATSSTIGQERRANPALTQDESAYVAQLLANLNAFPAYYARMGPANTVGAGPIDLSLPSRASLAELGRRLADGEWLVDLRDRTTFAAGHARGTFNFGLDGPFATYLGWVIAAGTPVTLLGATVDDVSTAQRELVRIGIDRPAGYATGDPTDWSDQAPASFPTATFADLALVRHHREVVVLDVRRVDEFIADHVVNAVNVPLPQLLDCLDQVPAGEVWVHCAAGYRASIAASMLSAAGRLVVSVDDEFAQAVELGLTGG